MRYLILSDIHANWEGLEAVMNDAAGHYDTIVCCGDIVGYGPDPNAVTEWVRGNVSAIVRGNHDKVCCGIEDPEDFNPIARAASIWTWKELSADNRAYLRELPQGPAAHAGFDLVHGSPLHEDDYMVSRSDVFAVALKLQPALTFFGHTHLQGGFLIVRRRNIGSLGKPMVGSRPAALQLESHANYLINPGSVGQPRDGDPRAAYAIFDSETKIVFFFRVPYDIETTQGKIRKAGLHDQLARRLQTGC